MLIKCYLIKQGAKILLFCQTEKQIMEIYEIKTFILYWFHTR